MGDSIQLREQQQSARPPLECRAGPRLKSNKALVYTARGAYFTGRALDLCASGIGMRVRHQLEAGNVVVVLLKKGGMFRSEHFAKVVNVWPVGGDSWVVGCEFAKPLSPEELRGFQV